MRTRSAIFWICLLSLCWLGGVKQVQCQGDSSTDESQKDQVVSDNKQKLTPLEQGMQPFYRMTNVFLGFVQNKDIQTDSVLYKEVRNLVGPILNGSCSPETQSSGSQPKNIDAMSYLQTHWRTYLLYGVGYAVCVVLGLIFIIIMPIVGCCFCCCRLCGRCGGKGQPKEGRHHKCRQYTCGTLLFVFNTVMLVGLVFAFMTNEQLRIRTSAESQGVIPRLQGWLNSLDGYTDTLVGDIRTVVQRDVDNKLTNIIKTVNGLPQAAIDQMDKLTNTSFILSQAKYLATNVTRMKELLGYVQGNKTELIDLRNQLVTELTNVKTEVENIISGCSQPSCNDLRTTIQALNANNDFNQADFDISAQINGLDQVGDIRQFIEDRETDYTTKKKKVPTATLR